MQCHWGTCRKISAAINKQLGDDLGTTGWVFLVFDPHHENVTKAPQQHILKWNPAQKCDKAKHTPNILRVFDIAKGKLCHPRDRLSESNAIVGTRLTKQLVHPEKKQKFQEQKQ